MKALSAALFGEAAGTIAGDLAQLLQQADNTDQRLTAIEDELREIKESEYARNLPKARRYLARAYLGERDPARRAADLERAESSCMDAAHAAVTPRQRVTAEHQLILIHLARGDLVAARDSIADLDAAAGDAVTDGSERLRTVPEVAVERLIASGELGDLSLPAKLRKLAGSGDERRYAATQALRPGNAAEFKLLRTYLADAAALGGILGLPTQNPRRFDEEHLEGVVPTLSGLNVGLMMTEPEHRAGGISCKIIAPADPSGASLKLSSGCGGRPS